MPFPFGKKHHGLSSSPEVTTQSRPLMYAKSDYASSLAPSSVDTASLAPSTATERPLLGKSKDATKYNPFSSYQILSPDNKPPVADKASKPRELVDDQSHTEATADEEPGASERPVTPPQGSRLIPWESYSKLPTDHPVFRYPAEVREKYYRKGIDPITKAEMDKALRGTVYGDKPRPFTGFVRRSIPMMSMGGTTIGGNTGFMI